MMGRVRCKLILSCELRCSYDAETSGDFKREEFEAVEKAGYVEDLIAKLKVVLFADFQEKGPLNRRGSRPGDASRLGKPLITLLGCFWLAALR